MRSLRPDRDARTTPETRRGNRPIPSRCPSPDAVQGRRGSVRTEWRGTRGGQRVAGNERSQRPRWRRPPQMPQLALRYRLGEGCVWSAPSSLTRPFRLSRQFDRFWTTICLDNRSEGERLATGITLGRAPVAQTRRKTVGSLSGRLGCETESESTKAHGREPQGGASSRQTVEATVVAFEPT